MKFKRRYGLDFPETYHDVYIDLLCAKKWREEPYKHGNLKNPWEHLLSACRTLFTNEEFCISPWTEEHAVDWTSEDFCITWGGASCSKSNDYGCFCLLDWITDPSITVTLMASTTREMLKMRSYEAVVRYFNLLKRNPYFLVPGKESRTSCAILNNDDPDNEGGGATTVKASIRGVAVNDGGSIQGAHLPYVRLILDEMALMRQQTFDQRTNLSIGAKDFRFFGLANPESLFDLSARASVPLEGWNSVDEFSTEWRTIYGKVRHHNGFRSPAITAPEKYPYLVNQKQIDKALREANGNADDPAIWTMIKGFPPPQGVERTVLTEQELITFQVQETAAWAAGQEPVKLAALDAAFTHTGDGCVLQFAEVGRIQPGVAALVLTDTIYLEIAASSKVPVRQQIVNQVREHLSAKNVPITMLAVDDSGTQGVADDLEMMIGPGVTRYNYGHKASDKHTMGGRDTFEDRYANKVTELWVLFSEFARCRQIRGLKEAAAKQITSRRFTKSLKNAKTMLEGKTEFKKRIGGRSPDEADAVCMVAGIARDVLGFFPGKAPDSVARPAFAPRPFRHGRSGISNPLRSSYSTAGRVSGYSAST